MSRDITTLQPAQGPLRGQLVVPGDKSVSHRAVMLASLCEGTSTVENFAPGADNRSTVSVFQALGARIQIDEAARRVTVEGAGLRGLRSPQGPLDCGNSGTTMRLSAGILAGLGLDATLVGDDSLMSRPMARISQPLSQRGALVEAAGAGGRAPLVIRAGGEFRGEAAQLKVASAQVKSALLLAAVLSGQALELDEPRASRDHTEVMLRALGVPVESSPHYRDTALEGRPWVKLPAWSGRWAAGTFLVPGDISSAAFLLVAAALVPGSDVLLRDCGATPTRAGVLHILERAGLPLEHQDARTAPGGEPVVDLRIRGDLGQARPFVLEAAEVPSLVDEIPVLSVLAAFLPGESVMKGLAELRVKESDRLERTLALLHACGRRAWVEGDDLHVQGEPGRALAAFQAYDPMHDHRMAASALVASLLADGPCSVRGLGCLEVSYPHLPEDLGQLQR